MKKIFPFIFCYLFNAFFCLGQSPNWLWAKGSSGPGYQRILGVAADAEGNAYATGYFDGDSVNFATHTLYNRGKDNFFIVKYSPTGNVLWASSAIITDSVRVFANSITNDKIGNEYITGYFVGDSIIVGMTTLIPLNKNLPNIFVVKYDSSGNVVWANLYGGSTETYGSSITTNGSNDVYITGGFHGNLTLGPSILYNSSSANNFFLLKVASSGRVIWAKGANISAPTNATGTGVATDANMNVYVTGYLYGNSFSLGNFTFTWPQDSEGYSVFAAKYDNNGHILWVQISVGDNLDWSNGIAVDANEDVYITGRFGSKNISFGSFTLHNQYPRGCTSNCGEGIFMVKYDVAGNPLWAYNPGSAYSGGSGVVSDGSGNAYFTGSFLIGSPLQFNDTMLDAPYGSSTGWAGYLATLGPGGKFVCLGTIQCGGSSQNAICLDGSGNTFIAGGYMINKFFIGADSLIQSGLENTFLVKFGCALQTDVQHLYANMYFEINPNPVTYQTVLKYSVPSGSKNSGLIIYDVLGSQRGIYKLGSTEGELAIDVSHLSAGIYFCALFVDGKVITKKMVVE